MGGISCKCCSSISHNPTHSHSINQDKWTTASTKKSISRPFFHRRLSADQMDFSNMRRSSMEQFLDQCNDEKQEVFHQRRSSVAPKKGTYDVDDHSKAQNQTMKGMPKLPFSPFLKPKHINNPYSQFETSHDIKEIPNVIITQQLSSQQSKSLRGPDEGMGPSPIINIERMDEYQQKSSDNKLKTISEFSRRSGVQFSELEPPNQIRDSMVSSKGVMGGGSKNETSPMVVMKKLKSFEKLNQELDVRDIRSKSSLGLSRIKTQLIKDNPNKTNKNDSTIDTTIQKKKVQSIHNYVKDNSIKSLDISNNLKVEKAEVSFNKSNINNDSIVFKEKHLEKLHAMKDFKDIHEEFIKQCTIKSIKTDLNSTFDHSKPVINPVVTNQRRISLILPQEALPPQTVIYDKSKQSNDSLAPVTKIDVPAENFYQSPPVNQRFKNGLSIARARALGRIQVFQSSERVSIDSTGNLKKKTTKDNRYEANQSSETTIKNQRRLTYSDALQPCIIISRPPEEVDDGEIINNSQNHFSQHGNQNMLETDRTSKKEKIKLRVKKTQNDQSYVIEIVDDQSANASTPQKILLRKRSSSTKDQQRFNFHQRVRDSMNESIKNSNDDSGSRTPTTFKRRRNPQLRKIINKFLGPLQQIKMQKKRKQPKDDAGKLKVKQDEANGLLNVKRLKTLAEVDEDEEKSNYENQSSINHNENNTSRRLEQLMLLTGRNQLTLNQSIIQETPKVCTPTQTKLMQQLGKAIPKKIAVKQKISQIDIQPLSPKRVLHEKMAQLVDLQKKQKEIAQSKRIIQMVRQKNNEMMQNQMQQIMNNTESQMPYRQSLTLFKTDDVTRDTLNMSKSSLSGSESYQIKLSKPMEDFHKDPQDGVLPPSFYEHMAQSFTSQLSQLQIAIKNEGNNAYNPRLKARIQTEPQILQWNTEKIKDDPDTDQLATVAILNPQNIVKRPTEMTSQQDRRSQTPLLQPVARHSKKDQIQKDLKDIKITQQIRLANQASIGSSAISSGDQSSMGRFHSDSESYYFDEDDYDIEYDDESGTFYSYEIDQSDNTFKLDPHLNNGSSNSSSRSPTRGVQPPFSENSSKSLTGYQKIQSNQSTITLNQELQFFESKPSITSVDINTLEPKYQFNAANNYNQNGKVSQNILSPNIIPTRKIITQVEKYKDTLQVQPHISKSKSFNDSHEEDKKDVIPITQQPIRMSTQNPPMTPNVRSSALLKTPEILDSLPGKYSHSPRSITTHSVISSRKNGKKKINQYLINYLIGEGNFAKVYNCLNEKDGKVYAMKIDHPNVLTLFEIIEEPNGTKLYLITDFVKNGNLAERVAKRPLSVEDMRKYFRDLINALEYCHECASIIHRDIKPANILVDENDNVKLADFGVSHIMVDGDDSITIRVGTSFAFSPELCQGGKYRGRPADVWACGVVLYHMTSKKYPFNGSNVDDLYKRIKTDEPDYKHINNDQLLDLFKQMFEKDPERRITVKQLKKHPWITNNGEMPMPELEMNQIEITQQDLKSVITRVVQMNRVMKYFKQNKERDSSYGNQPSFSSFFQQSHSDNTLSVVKKESQNSMPYQ